MNVHGICLTLAATGLFASAAIAGDDTTIQIEALGRYESGIFDDGAAEISSYDKFSKRLFVTNGALATIDVLDLSDPANPTLLFSIDATALGSGVTSVAARNGVVAAAIEAETSTDPGLVAFFDASGSLLNAVTVGALPDMVTFTPDGNFVLSANEGEPNDDYDIDPEGSVSIIDVSGGVLHVTQDDVRTVTFESLNDNLPDGVRVFGLNATPAQDMEPEYIAVSDDSSTAWVTLQENNAVAVINIADATLTAVAPLGEKLHYLGTPVIENYEIASLPVVGTTEAGQDIFLGGFSGLWFDGVNESNGNLRFITHPDRGPNAEPNDVDNDGVNERPFPLPEYQARLVMLEFDPSAGTLEIVDQMMLTRSDGVTPITGISNLLCSAPGFAYYDEEPVTIFGAPVELDPMGGDFEGVVRAQDGTLWMVDEYRPAIYHFDASGVMIDRFVPEGSNCSADPEDIVGTEALPAVYAQRRVNRGFEAVALHGDTLYAFIQSPIDNPDTHNDQSSKDSDLGRILAFDVTTGTTVAEYLYVFDGGSSDKIGDAVSIGPGSMLVIERNSSTGDGAIKNIYEINLDGATDLSTLPDSIVGPGGSLEGLAPEKLAQIGIVPVSKELFVDAGALGYTFEKPEGLAYLGPGRIALLNDNDFQLEGTIDPKSGFVQILDNPEPVTLGMIHFEGNGFDASNESDSIEIIARPTRGLYLPDSIASYSVDGETFLVTANEGDARDYDGFSEEDRVRDLTLDPIAFPMAAQLQEDENLGRLNTTLSMGDLDNDGDWDRIYSYGTRSFSIWNGAGELVWDSADQLEQITAEILPNDFNSTNDENGSFKNRSDDKGPEPEGVTTGTIDGRTYAFVGLERVGGVMVYDVTVPSAPTFIQYMITRDFAGVAEEGTAGDLAPEGLLFIPAADSPLEDTPLLVVTHEVSGTTTIFTVNAVDCIPVAADLNGDCVVDVEDLLTLLASWGPCPNEGECPADINRDGSVNVEDLLELLAQFG